MLFLLLFTLLVGYVIQKIATAIWTILYNAKINNLLENIHSKEDLLAISLKDLVNLVSEIFRRKGLKVKVTSKCGEECNGLLLEGIRYVEVHKNSLNNAMEVETAMKLAKCMRSNSIYKGMLITLGDFKYNTRAYSHKNVIECINGDDLLSLCKEVQMANVLVKIG